MADDAKVEGATHERATPPVVVDERLLPKRFVVVSNRLPYRIQREGERIQFERAAGGLVTALDPILQRTGGTWIGWSGTDEPVPERVLVAAGQGRSNDYYLRALHLSPEEVERYYLGYANRALWPLCHYFQEHCEFNHDEWKTYKRINRRFADAVVREYRPGDLVWVQDYHLLLAPAMVRERLPDARIGFFLHIPFPSEQLFQIEPHAEELIEGLLGADLVGFQIDSSARAFMDSVATLTPHRCSATDMRVFHRDRRVLVRGIPISIDFEHFDLLARREAVLRQASAIRESYRADIIAVGVDRLDYSKGVLERLRAIELMLDRHPDVQGRFTFVQISAPSRSKLPAYRQMRDKIEWMVGHINGRFGGRGCIPIDYRYQTYPQEELAAYYRASDLALVTPLRDGMNLVAKEYVASRSDLDGVLVLSRFAGACQELSDAVVVNPYDPETMAERIYRAILMSPAERRGRMQRLRDVVRRNDIYWWLERTLRELP